MKACSVKRTQMLKLVDKSLKTAVVMKNIKEHILVANKAGNLNQKI